MSEQAGLVNVYVCDECSGTTVTRNRDTGTTPFAMRCRKAGCGGAATSTFYTGPQSQVATHTWIRPNDQELEHVLQRFPQYAADIREHVSLGGMVLIDNETGVVHDA